MGKPAARSLDLHICPIHVGGIIALKPGIPKVMIKGQPAVSSGDMCTCPGPPNPILLGSTSVFIEGKPAARMGDATLHGGIISSGCPQVLIGG